jgi:hypothetical protein
MPVRYKLLISVLALIMGAAVFFLDTHSGGGTARWVALGLGPFMVFAIWLFPETKAKEIRREAAKRR